MNEDTLSKVRAAYRLSGGNLAQVAKDLGLSVTECRQAFPQTPLVTRPLDDDGPTPGKDAKGVYEVGRKALRSKIVAIRHCTSWWREEDRKVIADARKRYDAGTHLMTTGRDGQWIILYSWKLRKPVTPQPYFYGVFA